MPSSHTLDTVDTHFDDVDILRTGASARVLGHAVAAPSTIGTWLRSFTFGHTRQLDQGTEHALTTAWAAGAGGRCPSGRFAANAAWLLLATLAANLLRWPVLLARVQ